MTNLLSLAVHMAVLASVWTLGRIVLQRINEPPEEDRLNKIIAIALGFASFLGAKSAGITLDTLMYRAALQSSVTVYSLLAVALPLPAGLLVSWLLVRRAQSDHRRATYLKLMVAAFLICIFGEIYSSEVQASEVARNNFIATLSFVVGLGLFIFLPDRGRKTGVGRVLQTQGARSLKSLLRRGK